jgi:hypothetical protein
MTPLPRTDQEWENAWAEYRAKLQSSGCKKLITNARWGMDVELIDLCAARMPYTALAGGWYACACGAVGFKPDTAAVTDMVMDVQDCPACFER